VKPPAGTAVSPLGEERASSFPHHPLRIIQECHPMTTPAMTTRLLAARAAVAVVVLAATVSLFVTALDVVG
jgi:hypothetical protein